MSAAHILPLAAAAAMLCSLAAAQDLPSDRTKSMIESLTKAPIETPTTDATRIVAVPRTDVPPPVELKSLEAHSSDLEKFRAEAEQLSKRAETLRIEAQTNVLLLRELTTAVQLKSRTNCAQIVSSTDFCAGIERDRREIRNRQANSLNLREQIAGLESQRRAIEVEAQAAADAIEFLTGAPGPDITNSAGTDRPSDLPFLVPNTLLVMVDPEITDTELSTLIEERGFEVLDTYAEIGTIKVRTDLSELFQQEITDQSPNDALMRGIQAVTASFADDPRVQAVAFDTLFSGNQITNLMTASEISTSLAQEDNWGLADIEAEAAWAEPGAEDGIVFGVLDAGFSRHEDLTFSILPGDMLPHDHGNHVAGIACAKHNNTGVRGVLPNCFVRARAGQSLTEVSAGDALAIYNSLGDSIGQMVELVGVQEDIRSFNVSLGNNWSRLNINPDAISAATWQSLVEGQGKIVLAVYRKAAENDKVVFSAAGNDSRPSTGPIGAKYASPFNWAALAAQNEGLRSGIVVAAHDRDGHRASFSNVGAQISCPGVDIRSTIASDEAHHLSTGHYATMSGTSMAAPFCAAAHSLLTLVRPGYSGAEIVDCMRASTDLTDEGVPMLRLSLALAACPRR